MRWSSCTHMQDLTRISFILIRLYMHAWELAIIYKNEHDNDEDQQRDDNAENETFFLNLLHEPKANRTKPNEDLCVFFDSVEYEIESEEGNRTKGGMLKFFNLASILQFCSLLDLHFDFFTYKNEKLIFLSFISYFTCEIPYAAFMHFCLWFEIVGLYIESLHLARSMSVSAFKLVLQNNWYKCVSFGASMLYKSLYVYA